MMPIPRCLIFLMKQKSGLIVVDAYIDKYNSQYNNLEIIYDNTFHNQYFILDRENNTAISSCVPLVLALVIC